MDVRKLQEYMRRFKRREDFLISRIYQREDETRSSHDKCELRTLQWVLQYIADHELEAAEHLHKWREERKEEW